MYIQMFCSKSKQVRLLNLMKVEQFIYRNNKLTFCFKMSSIEYYYDSHNEAKEVYDTIVSNIENNGNKIMYFDKELK